MVRIAIEFTDKEAKLIKTWIRRSIYEDYYKRVMECYKSEEENKNNAYDCLYAFQKIEEQL